VAWVWPAEFCLNLLQKLLASFNGLNFFLIRVGREAGVGRVGAFVIRGNQLFLLALHQFLPSQRKGFEKESLAVGRLSLGDAVRGDADVKWLGDVGEAVGRDGPAEANLAAFSLRRHVRYFSNLISNRGTRRYLNPKCSS
jgi:hypothetical protein